MIKNNSIRKMKRDIKAVSPVIATILLVLVAVASAVAFWLVLGSWQDDQADKLKDTDIGNELSGSIKTAGSTTVQPFLDVAAASFQNVHPNVKISVGGGGSGIGYSSAVGKTADIGAISEAYNPASGSSQIVTHTIGYDGVVIATSHVLTATQLSALTTEVIQEVYGHYDSATSTWEAPTITAWNQLTFVLDGGDLSTLPVAAGAEIDTVSRAEKSGTQDTFIEKFLNSKAGTATFPAQDVPASGNDGVISELTANPNAIGFTSFGYAAQANLKIFSFDGVAPSIETIKDNSYGPARPLVLLTNGAPTGITKAFIDYIQDEKNNKLFADQAGYVSLYA